LVQTDSPISSWEVASVQKITKLNVGRSSSQNKDYLSVLMISSVSLDDHISTGITHVSVPVYNVRHRLVAIRKVYVAGKNDRLRLSTDHAHVCLQLGSFDCATIAAIKKKEGK
jgi:hypothetical protein